MSRRKQLEAFLRDVEKTTRCPVAYDPLTCGLYATDAGMHQVSPKAVCLPRTAEDVRSIVACARACGLPVIPRGGGTSLGGQAVGSGVVIDFTTHMRGILELNCAERWVRVEPGIVLGELNAALRPHGLQFGPDPATGNRATVGGMIGNNSSGSRSLVYGLTSENLLETELLLYGGASVKFEELTPQRYGELCRNDDVLGKLLRGFKRIVEENYREIEQRFPKVMRRVQGYNLDAFPPRASWNLSKLIAGSEGTLGIVLQAKLKLVPLPGGKALCVVHFAELPQALASVEEVLSWKPTACELIDHEVIACARKSKAVSGNIDFIEGDPGALLLVEFTGHGAEHAKARAEEFSAAFLSPRHAYAAPVLSDAASQASAWHFRKSGLGVLLGMKGDRKPLAFIEDTCVPVRFLPQYVERLLRFCSERKVKLVVYAHASVGTLHLRPALNLKDPRDVALMKDIARYTFSLVKEYGGSISGEHGDGRVRSPFLEEFFGPRIYRAFKEVKELFDPQGGMNPGIIVDPNPIDCDLKTGPGLKPLPVRTAYHFREAGSFHAAYELCSAVGVCRQTLEGTMCPSFRVTRQEKHSTRARANAVRLAATGQLRRGDPFPRALTDVMDLCLMCKACKAECPSSVDVARLKAEYLSQVKERYGAPLRERIVAASPSLARRLSGWKAPVVNFLLRRKFFRFLLDILVGFHRRRVPPLYARKPFWRLFQKRVPHVPENSRTVVLFDDTYMNFHDVGVGLAACELLEACSYRVILARAGCCQRPRLSHGFLQEAAAAGEKTLRALDQYARAGLPIVVCEPGCASALVDDLPDLIDDEELGERVRRHVFLLEDFLARELRRGKLSCGFASPFKGVLLHGHCHQKALFSMTAAEELLRTVPGLRVKLLQAGCCGMAGSFGYEKEHYEVSLAAGEERLFPAVRSLPEDWAVVASGFSCRHQILHATGRRAYHFAEVLRPAR